MGILRPSHLRALLIGFLFGAFVGCSKDHIKQEGTESAGGGSAAYSTVGDVDKALDLAIKMANEPSHQMNIYVQFFMDAGRKSSSAFIKRPEHVFPSLGNLDPAVELDDISDATKFRSPVLEALTKNNIERRLKGDCLTTVQGEHKDASVSKLTLDADICISLGNLTRIPPSSLLREVMGLLLHEAVHMAGAGEAEAKIWQKEFSDYFGLRFGDAISDTITGETLKAFGAARKLLKRANDMSAANATDPKIYGVMGRAAQIMIELPDLLDPVALRLKMKVSKPELYDNYASSVLAFITEAQVKFQFPPLTPSHSLFSKPNSDYAFTGADVTLPSQIQVTLGKLNTLFEQANENFLAFTGAEGAESVCVAPGPRLNKDNFNRAFHKPVFPKVNCAP